MLLAFGVSQMAIAWFALRHGQWWGLWVLIALDLMFMTGWALIYSAYVRAGAPLSVMTAPPNRWIPALLRRLRSSRFK